MLKARRGEQGAEAVVVEPVGIAQHQLAQRREAVPQQSGRRGVETTARQIEIPHARRHVQQRTAAQAGAFRQHEVAQAGQFGDCLQRHAGEGPLGEVEVLQDQQMLEGHHRPVVQVGQVGEC